MIKINIRVRVRVRVRVIMVFVLTWIWTEECFGLLSKHWDHLENIYGVVGVFETIDDTKKGKVRFMRYLVANQNSSHNELENFKQNKELSDEVKHFYDMDSQKIIDMFEYDYGFRFIIKECKVEGNLVKGAIKGT